MKVSREPQIRNVQDVANAIRFAENRTIFFIGAGCSITAGIPGAPALAKRMVCDAARRFGAAADSDALAGYLHLVGEKALDTCQLGNLKAAPTEATIDWYRVYDAMFDRHYTAPDDVRELFASVVEEANGTINWAHLCLGELVLRGFAKTVLTTNFDQLVLSGMARAGILPVVCDGTESLNRIDGAPRHPQLIELHGSRHTYILRNAAEHVAEMRDNPQASAVIEKLFQHATTFVAVGYGGREDGVMDLLVRAGEVYPDKNLFWVNHSPKPDSIGPKVRDFLATSRNGGLLLGQDADRFFLELCAALRVGAPSAISRPLEAVGRLLADVARSAVTDRDIGAEIKSAERFLGRLNECAAEKGEPDPVEAIREARLAGAHKQAYELAIEAIRKGGGAEKVSAELLSEAASAAYFHGERSPEPQPFLHAIEWEGRVAASHDRGEFPLDWARSQNNLGNALQALGERESGPERLEEAVAAYQAALLELTRERVPLAWAATQNNIGNVLLSLGQRSPESPEFTEAVACFQAALEERTRERVPLDWATTQNNLGIALAELGERENCTGRLTDALEAFRAAQEVWTRERVPLDWARAQNCIGNALRTLGQLERDIGCLTEAVAAFQEALQVWTREAGPHYWAGLQDNLGFALACLGSQLDGVELLEQAVAAHRAALQERTRERVPFLWAITQIKLGNVLAMLGEREGGTARLEEAVRAFRAALEELEAMSDRATATQRNLDRALALIAERRRQ